MYFRSSVLLAHFLQKNLQLTTRVMFRLCPAFLLIQDPLTFSLESGTGTRPLNYYLNLLSLRERNLTKHTLCYWMQNCASYQINMNTHGSYTNDGIVLLMTWCVTCECEVFLLSLCVFVWAGRQRPWRLTWQVWLVIIISRYKVVKYWQTGYSTFKFLLWYESIACFPEEVQVCSQLILVFCVLYRFETRSCWGLDITTGSSGPVPENAGDRPGVCSGQESRTRPVRAKPYNHVYNNYILTPIGYSYPQ